MDESPATSSFQPATLGDSSDTVGDDTYVPFTFPPETFERLLRELVAQEMPRQFALCAVEGGTFDAWIAAWGFAMEDQAVVVAVDEPTVGYFQSPDSALKIMSAGHSDKMRLIWCDELTPATTQTSEA